MQKNSTVAIMAAVSWTSAGILLCLAFSSGVAGIVIAVRTSLRVEQQLKESEDRYRGAFENAPFGLCLSALNGRFVQVNAALCRLLGYSEPALLNLTWLQLTHVDHRELSQEAMRILLADPSQCVELEKQYLHRSGKAVWARTRISMVRDRSGRPLHCIAHVEDITERKHAERALQNSEEKFRQMAENIREVFWMLDPATFETIYISPAYEQVWGRTCESIQQNSAAWLESIHPDDQERTRHWFATGLKGEPGELEFRILTPEGQEKWIRDRAFPIRDEDGKLIRITGIAEDITGRNTMNRS